MQIILENAQLGIGGRGFEGAGVIEAANRLEIVALPGSGRDGLHALAQGQDVQMGSFSKKGGWGLDFEQAGRTPVGAAGAP